MSTRPLLPPLNMRAPLLSTPSEPQVSLLLTNKFCWKKPTTPPSFAFFTCRACFQDAAISPVSSSNARCITATNCPASFAKCASLYSPIPAPYSWVYPPTPRNLSASTDSVTSAVQRNSKRRSLLLPQTAPPSLPSFEGEGETKESLTKGLPRPYVYASRNASFSQTYLQAASPSNSPKAVDSSRGVNYDTFGFVDVDEAEGKPEGGEGGGNDGNSCEREAHSEVASDGCRAGRFGRALRRIRSTQHRKQDTSLSHKRAQLRRAERKRESKTCSLAACLLGCVRGDT